MINKNILNLSAWPVIVVCSKFIKLSLSSSIGLLKLSGIMVAVPLMGALYSLPQTCVFLIALLGIKHIVFGFPLTLGIPTIAATFSWACDSSHTCRAWKLFDVYLHCVIPLGCFIIFVTHPVGKEAWWYACYWLIPVVLWLTKASHTFARALKSTFVAHAVGSIVWLFSGILNSEQWMALIPVVAIERFALALASSGLYYVLAQVYSSAHKPTTADS